MDEDQAQPWKIPPIVQELAAGVLEPPSRYVVREQDRPAAAAAVAMPEPIPIVDLSRLSAAADDGAGADEVAKLRSALQNWGLFLQKYSNLANGKDFRFEGYGNDVVLSEDQTLDWCDRLTLIVEPESRVFPGLWPARPAAFVGVLREYIARCRRDIAGVVLAALATLLGLPEDRFAGMMEEGDAKTHARFNYYPRCPRPDLVVGLKSHSDASVIGSRYRSPTPVMASGTTCPSSPMRCSSTLVIS
ncbi:unnamed protein product [Urochloa humidicola]